MTMEFGDVTFDLYVENNKLFINTQLRNGVTITHNIYSRRPLGWDVNSNDMALEIIDDKQNPVIQMTYDGLNHVTINGFFPAEEGKTLIINSDGIRWVSNLNYFLKPMFRYPSWEYPGILVDER